MSNAPFFIVGSGRSGSTLLRMILASHSRIAIPPETWFLIPLCEQIPLERPLDASAVEKAIAIMTGHYRWPDMGVDASAFRQEVTSVKEPYLKDVVEIVYRKHLKEEGKTRWGDKTPGYIKIVPELAKLYPDARFIHLVRDGRDVAKSFQSTGWYGPLLHDNTREWTEALAYETRWSRSALASKILSVRYEDMIGDSEAIVRKICAFLGEEFEPQMLSWEGQVSRLVPKREMSIHGKLGRKPDASDIERWKREMSPWEIFVAEASMAPYLERHGYALKYRGPEWRAAFAIARLYCLTVLRALSFQTRMFRYLRKLLTSQRKADRAQSAGSQANSQ